MHRREFIKAVGFTAFSQPTRALAGPFCIGFVGPRERELEYRSASSSSTLSHLKWVAAKEADALIVASPLERRAEDALSTLQSGRHVLIEPPIAMSYPEVDRMLGEANRRDLRIGSAYPLRYARHSVLVRERLQRELDGKLQNVTIEASAPENATCGYLGASTHLVDLVRWLVGKPAGSVTARSDEAAKADVPAASLQLLVSFDGFDVTYDGLPGIDVAGGWKMTLDGEHAGLQLDGSGHLRERHQGGDWRTQLVAPVSDALPNLVSNFVNACQSEQEPEANAVDGMAGVGLLTGAVDSARAGHPVTILYSHYEFELDRSYEWKLRMKGKD